MADRTMYEVEFRYPGDPWDHVAWCDTEEEATAMATAGGELWITRMERDDTDRDVACIGYGDNGARETFDHAKRVITRFGEPKAAKDLEAGDLIVTLLAANGDSTDDDPLIVPSKTADWFLDSWLKVPAAWRRDR